VAESINIVANQDNPALCWIGPPILAYSCSDGRKFDLFRQFRFAFVVFVSLLLNCQMLCGQTVAFGEVAWVGGTAKTLNMSNEVSYTRSKKLDVWSYAKVTPHATLDVEVRVKYRFKGKLSDGTEYDSGWATLTKTLKHDDDVWEIGGHEETATSKEDWTYEFKAEKKVGGAWIAIGSTSVTFRDSAGGGGGGGPGGTTD
jgi:hypothetical protein